MSTLRNPVGPQPPSVYWRRRLLVLLGIVAVIVVVILIVSRPGSGQGSSPDDDPKKSSAPTDSASPNPEATDEAAGDGSQACDPSVIAVVPVTDADSYQPEVTPMLSMTITNTGAAACTFDVGTGAQLYSIVSGADPIWNSRDCQSGATSTPQVLPPGETLSTTPFAWDRTRSSTTTCTSERPQVTGGGATYRLSVELGEAKSESDKPFLLY